MADWLCDIVTGKLPSPEPEAHTAAPGEAAPPVLEAHEKRTPQRPGEEASAAKFKLQSTLTYSNPTYPSSQPLSATPLNPSTIPHTRGIINPASTPSLEAAHAAFSSDPPIYTTGNTGTGRIISFSTPQPLTLLIERIAAGVGHPKGFPVAIPQSSSIEDLSIRTVGVCAGSGSSVLHDCAAGGEGGLLFTGELAHHEALAVTERGGCVVSLFHSNSERGYLAGVMKTALEREVRKEWDRVRKGVLEGGQGRGEGWDEVWNDDGVGVDVSERDRDPYGIVVLQGSQGR